MGRNGEMEWSISIGPLQSRKVVQFFRNVSGWTEPIHSVSDQNFRKFWLNGSRPVFPGWLDHAVPGHHVPSFERKYEINKREANNDGIFASFTCFGVARRL